MEENKWWGIDFNKNYIGSILDSTWFCKTKKDQLKELYDDEQREKNI